MLVSSEENEVLYSKQFIIFATHKGTPKARVFHYTKLERHHIDRSFSLLGQLINYEENEVL
jgi:hypothetical protein